jgi:signal transduction histidine kinase
LVHTTWAPASVAIRSAAAAEDHGPLATKQGIALEVAAPPRLPAVGDARRVEQVVANLLRNAVRATPPGGRIAVHARLHGGAAEVRVEDTGRGLSEAQLQALFQPFGQVHEGAEVPDGTGLGLYLCRGIVEQHGGRLWAESAGPGRGAAFTFTLPQAARHGEEKETAALDASRTPAR